MRTALFFVATLTFAQPAGRDWPAFSGGPANGLYSRLNGINTSNVRNLKVAWTYDSKDSFKGSELQCNPLVIDGIVYATTPALKVIALDGATGQLKWSFDPFDGAGTTGKKRNRGLMYWNDGEGGRLFVGASYWMYSLSARTGQPVKSFGQNGRIDLRQGFGRDPETFSLGNTTPGVIYKDLMILGHLTSEDLPSGPGDIRAFDLRTGKQRWIFHTIPHPGEFGADTWPEGAYLRTGGANSWPGMALDEKRGLVFVPTGSAAFDFYGSDRHGDNLFANSLICLKAATGERVWHFQAVKHDVWDRDFPTAPVLVTVKRDGKMVDGVAQAAKSGVVFVFERATGKPLFPIEYRPAPPSPVDGEKLATTQPFPLKPAPFARQQLTEDLLTRRTPEAHAAALARFRGIRSGPQFEPPTFEGTIVFPGFDGGAEWGGQAFDPDTGIFYVNSNEMAWILKLVPRKAKTGRMSTREIYLQNCAGCHRSDRRGTPPEFPALLELGGRRSSDQVAEVIRKGAGRMPGFAHLGNAAVDGLTAYLMSDKEMTVEVATRLSRVNSLKYSTDGYNKFLDADGYPAIAPPWGTLNAIDLNTGEYVWKIPFGEYPELQQKDTGSENYGGPLVTAGGLLFIGASNFDRKFRAYDKRTGKLLWETLLPASGNATPATYEIAGRQYVLIAAGGGKSGAPSGSTWVAFALPQ
jgi:quinoprotein glucose dehydrogenase